jgi:hypothetical protein
MASTTEKKIKSSPKTKKPKRGDDSLKFISEDPIESNRARQSGLQEELPAENRDDSIRKEISQYAPTEQEKYKDNDQDVVSQDDSDEGSDEDTGDTDALTTMNAIMEYNRKLMQRLNQLESQVQEQGNHVSQEALQHTVQGTYNEIKDKYDSGASGTHHSFELPIGDMMKGYGNLNTTPLPEQKKDEETSTTKDKGDEGNKISIGNGEKDDIVVKVEATKTGITFSIHIPRN